MCVFMENAVNRKRKKNEKRKKTEIGGLIAKASDEPENNKRIYKMACNS